MGWAARQVALNNGAPVGADVHHIGECRVFVGHEAGRWHLSIAHPRRLPTWDELKEARNSLLPDNLLMAMLLPPKADYINMHPFCFHLWEIQGEEAESHAPSLRSRIVVP